MNDQERQLITDFVRRVAGADRPSGGPSPWAGQQQQAAPARPPLPPVDRDADGLILELFNKHPEARYRVTQTAFVQEHALAEAQNRIQQLEYELERTRREAQAAPSGGGGFLGGLFGGGRPAPQPPMPPPPQPVHAPGYQPGMFGDPRQQQGRGGMGFLGTAGAAMAGVAGGMVAGSMLSNMMGGGGHGAAQAAEAPAATAATPAAGAATEGGWGTPTAAPDDAGWGGDDEEV